MMAVFYAAGFLANIWTGYNATRMVWKQDRLLSVVVVIMFMSGELAILESIAKLIAK